MRSIFDKTTRDELVNRIDSLNENAKAQWGKMTVYQMVKHCSLWEDMMLGRKNYKRAFMGYLFGKMALRSILKDNAPLRRSTPTLSEFKIKETEGDIAGEKAKWIAKIQEYENFSNPSFIHPFFGKMTQEQIGYLVYKHSDHHLRQFNS